MTSAIPVQRSTNWANKPTGSWSLCWFQINPWSDEWMAKNIWKSYIWTADKDVNESDPRSNVHYLSSSENKAWKNIFLAVQVEEDWEILKAFHVFSMKHQNMLGTRKSGSMLLSEQLYTYPPLAQQQSYDNKLLRVNIGLRKGIVEQLLRCCQWSESLNISLW